VGLQHLETVLFPNAHQHFVIAAAIAAKMKIVTDHQTLDGQPVHQHPLDELLRGQAAQRPIELQAEHPVHAGASQRLGLLANAHQPRRRLLAHEILARLRFKQHCHRTGAIIGGALLELPEDRLVAEMDAVEGTHGGHRATVLGAQIVQPANQKIGCSGHRIESAGSDGLDRPALIVPGYGKAAEYIPASGLDEILPYRRGRKSRSRTPPSQSPPR